MCRLEKLLVALLGHTDSNVRSQAAVLLNGFYDQHDWQRHRPFAPVIRSVYDRFTIEVRIEEDAPLYSDSNTAELARSSGPKGIFLILSCPSFNPTVKHSVYSYHRFRWTAGTVAGKPPFAKQQWIGCIDFGVFTRCGFYDWRVVKANESDGSWIAVEATLSELRRSSSSVLTFKKIKVGDETEAGERVTAGDLDTDLTATYALQGRWIVQPSRMSDEQLHEIFVDQHDARWDSETGELNQRGTFASVSASLAKLQQCGVTTLYVMGSLSRDNGDILYTNHGEITYQRPDASPFAVTCRATPNDMLGGVGGFGELMKTAKRANIKIVIDSLSRISSTRHHRKYWPLVLHSLDEQGKRIPLYGTDGRSIHYEDSTMLNYRKVEAWDLLVSDIKSWSVRLGADGVRLDNAQAWPQILLPDMHELSRLDADGQPHYSPDEILLGEVVVSLTEKQGGFWNTKTAAHWPNPLFVKLCKEIWCESPHFMIIGECWEGQGMDDRPSVLAKSGVVPQLQQLPYKLSGVFGKHINEDSCVVSLERPEPVSVLQDWFEGCHKRLPHGAFLIQSSCSHSSPLPGLLYGRGAWPAVDLLFLLPDIPSTFGGEMDGMAFRLDVTNVYTTAEVQQAISLNKQYRRRGCGSTSDILQYPRGGMHRGEDVDKSFPGRLPSTRSLVNLDGEERKSVSGGLGGYQGRWASQHVSGADGSGGGVGKSGAGLLSRVRSLSKFEAMTSLPMLEEEHLRTLGPEYGFDLKKIKGHYDSRRLLRRKFRIFRHGLLMPLKATTNEIGSGIRDDVVDVSWLQQVLAFVRVDTTTGDCAVVLINFSGQTLEDVTVSLRSLGKPLQTSGFSENTVFESVDLISLSMSELELLPDNCSINATTGSKGIRDTEMLSMAELLTEPQVFRLDTYSSLCRGFTVANKLQQDAAGLLNELYASSFSRLEQLVRTCKAQIVVQSQCSTSQAELLKHQAKLSQNFVFAAFLEALNAEDNLDSLADCLDRISHIMEAPRRPAGEARHQEPLSLYDICVDSGIFVQKEDLGVRLLAKLQRIREGASKTDSIAMSKVAVLAHQVLDANSLGPIVFVTPELGKWSTVGGLGVMVDELCYTLAGEFGQEVWVISPYYERNRHGETGYLARDNIHHSFNVDVQVGSHERVSVGVHEGTVRGVRMFFLQNPQVFPNPYPDVPGPDVVRFLVVFSKATLELLCHLRTIPQLICTNDWACGLVPAYVKQRSFGDAFSSTTCYHLIHNLDPSYEGRIYPNRREDFSWIHGLPGELLVDPNWHQFVINPSRCALIQSDAWGTVSPSYRDDLTGISRNGQPSPLAPLLNRYKSPFAFPNGIPLQSRLERLTALGCASHDEAKGRVQTKYFGFEEPDLSIPLLAFIGRITSQKGVHLIVEAAENIILRYDNKIQILVGGSASQNDSYSSRCAQKMWDLRSKYPWAFWANPNEFFTDGSLVNLGADFGLMPSAFEPGGIVQQEFFIAGTPVIAYRTGGLKDTVSEFSLEHLTGNGFTFESYNLGDFLYAMERAIRLFGDRSKYLLLRKNARASVISCEQVARAWLGEFCRLRRKMAVSLDKVRTMHARLPVWSEEAWLKRRKAVKEDLVLEQEEQITGHEKPDETPLAPDPSPKMLPLSPIPQCVAPQSAPPEVPVLPKLQSVEPQPQRRLSGGPSVGSRERPDTTPLSPPPRHWNQKLTSAATAQSLQAGGSQMTMGSGGASVTSGTSFTASEIITEKRPYQPPGSISPHVSAANVAIKRVGTVSQLQLIPVRLKYVPHAGRSRPRTVALAGSFDDWRVRRPLSWDNALQAFIISVALQPGRYMYKLIVDGDWLCNTEDIMEKDALGNINNVLVVQ
eukprot:GHVQ01022382.1.p1 GENE.GHVQ01022382.1~~GHVQ01022382.1.p1  ORF type:complete len:1848 (+),score=155.63 GHVQ01022382.1:2238-7781(+)